MKAITYNSRNGSLMFALTMLALLALSAAGCAPQSTGIQIMPVGNRDVLDLSAADIIKVMQAAGFSDAQIYEYGTEVHDGIARRGAVHVQIDGTIEVVFAAKGSSVYISTLGRGHFIYNVNEGWQNTQAR